MESFFTFIFFTIVVIYLAGVLGRWFLRRWLRRKQEEIASRFGGQASAGGFTGAGTYGRQNSTGRAAREGEVKIRTTGQAGKRVNGKVGDYVDYEEIIE